MSSVQFLHREMGHAWCRIWLRPLSVEADTRESEPLSCGSRSGLALTVIPPSVPSRGPFSMFLASQNCRSIGKIRRLWIIGEEPISPIALNPSPEPDTQPFFLSSLRALQGQPHTSPGQSEAAESRETPPRVIVLPAGKALLRATQSTSHGNCKARSHL